MSSIWRVEGLLRSNYLGATESPESTLYGDPCEIDGHESIKRVRPLMMEWDPTDSCELGSFTWPDSARPVVTSTVAATLIGYPGIELSPVVCSNSPRVKGRRRAEIRGWNSTTVLQEVWITNVVGLDRQGSTGGPDPEISCEVCGEETWHIAGVESIESEWDATAEEIVYHHYDRLPDCGAFVSESQLNNALFFYIKELSQWVFCTDEAKQLANQEGWTNLLFLEYGETV